jgi:transposase
MAMCHANYVHIVMLITYIRRTIEALRRRPGRGCLIDIRRILCVVTSRNCVDSGSKLYIIVFTHMKKQPGDRSSNHTMDAKADVLRRQGALHPNPNLVQDEAFRQGEFFDARDLVQVRYEMLRRHQVDGKPVTAVAGAFGVSRQAFYTTEAAFEEMGISGLLPRRRGPQHAHKCTDEVLDFVEQWRAASPTEKDVTGVIQKRFGVSINPRSIERALARRKKKR